MNPGQARQRVLAALYSVAPDLAGAPLDPSLRFRDQFEFDSMDFMHFALALHRATGVAIPEADYPRLASLESAVAYLCANAAGDGSG